MTQRPYKSYEITYHCPHCKNPKCGQAADEIATTKAYGHSIKTAIASFNREKACRYMKAIKAIELR